MSQFFWYERQNTNGNFRQVTAIAIDSISRIELVRETESASIARVWIFGSPVATVLRGKVAEQLLSVIEDRAVKFEDDPETVAQQQAAHHLMEFDM